MVDRTLQELREFLNGQASIPAEKRDWALTDGEMHTLGAHLKATVMLYTEKETPETKKNYQGAFQWSLLLGTYCTGFSEHLSKNIKSISAEAEELIRKKKEREANAA